jgi:predicted chitinase
MTLTLEHKKYLGGAAALIVFLLLIHSFILAVKRAQLVNACERAFGSLDATQKDSIRLIVKMFEKYGDKDQNKLIYILATARHESNFRPIQERRASSSQTDVYNRQNAYWYTGYYGRGFVQLTWDRNYEKMSKLLGVDFLSNPDLVMQPKYAARILVQGMLEGAFTRRPLEKYINGSQVDFYNARWVVNGLDRAERVEGYAEEIQENMIT